MVEAQAICARMSLQDTYVVLGLGPVIELALAPVFLLVAIGSFLNVCAGRLARVVDRARNLEPLVLTARGSEHDLLVEEARLLDKRIGTINRAILMAVIAAILTVGLVFVLFGAGLAGLDLGNLIALMFMAGVAALGSSFALFLIETRLAIRMVRVPRRILTHKEEA